MARSIRIYGDPVLRKKAAPISTITPEIRALAQEMVDLMIAHEAVGLAATQIGELCSIFVMRDEQMNEAGDYEFSAPQIIINPKLSSPSKEKKSQEEGCLSLPGISLDIIRPKSVQIRYQTLTGEWKEELFVDLKARVAMHENDHLNGVLILDRANRRDRAEALRELSNSSPQRRESKKRKLRK